SSVSVGPLIVASVPSARTSRPRAHAPAASTLTRPNSGTRAPNGTLSSVSDSMPACTGSANRYDSSATPAPRPARSRSTPTPPCPAAGRPVAARAASTATATAAPDPHARLIASPHRQPEDDLDHRAPTQALLPQDLRDRVA